MSIQDKYISLYPSHWLYNAGAVGLAEVLLECGIQHKEIFKADGILKIPVQKAWAKHKVDKFELPIIAYKWLYKSWQLLTEQESEQEKEIIKEVWGKLFNLHYRGFFNANTNYLYKGSKTSEPLLVQLGEYFKQLTEIDTSATTCMFCGIRRKSSYKNIYTSEHSKFLGSSRKKGVPNAFWNCNPDTGNPICDLCSFILLCVHLSLTKLSDRSQIFVNAPSFELMFHLNQFVKQIMGSSSSEEARDKREILAMSVIEYATKIKTTLGTWSVMNIEVVSRFYDSQNKKDRIEFYSLPEDTLEIISDRRIAAYLRDIGEFKILNLVLDQKFESLIEIAYRLLKESMSSKKNFKYINDVLFLDRNKKNLEEIANQILKLYAQIEDKNQLKQPSFSYE